MTNYNERLDEILNRYAKAYYEAKYESRLNTCEWALDEAKQALSDLMLDAVIEELQDLWTSGSSSHRDIRVGYDRGLTVHERIAELTAQKGN